MKFFFTILIFLLLTGCGEKQNNRKDIEQISSQTPAASSDEVTLAVIGKIIEKKDTQVEYPDIACTINQINFKVTPDGDLQWGDDYENSVKLSVVDNIEMAYFYVRDNKLYIFYTETDSDTATSRAEMIDLSTKQKKWNTEIYGFNLGQPYIKGDFAYVTTLGLAGKLNLMTGNYEYKFEDLYDYEKTAFNHFDTIIFKGNETLFLAKNYHSKRIDSLIVDEITNKIRIVK